LWVWVVFVVEYWDVMSVVEMFVFVIHDLGDFVIRFLIMVDVLKVKFMMIVRTVVLCLFNIDEG